MDRGKTMSMRRTTRKTQRIPSANRTRSHATQNSTMTNTMKIRCKENIDTQGRFQVAIHISTWVTQCHILSCTILLSTAIPTLST